MTKLDEGLYFSDRLLGQGREEDWVSKVAWRIVGAIESPLIAPKLTHMISNVVKKYVPHNEQKRTIETINGWYERRDGRPALADHFKEEVDELVLRGVAQELLRAKPVPQHDTLFWAIGAVDTETAAETIQASWCPEQIDALLDHAISTLQVLCEDSHIIDPSDALGFKVDGGKAYVNPEYIQERIRTLHRTDWTRPDMYQGVAMVIQLIMTIRPDQFPILVEKADHPTVQRWALFIVSRYLRTDRLQALDWLKGKPSEPLIAIAIVHALEDIRELGSEAEHQGRDQQAREEAYGTASRLLSGLVNQLAQYESAESVRWIAELYEHRVFLLGTNRRTGIYDLGEELEDHCIDRLVDLVRGSWDNDLREALKSNASWGAVTQQTLPLGTVASKVSGDFPERAAEIASIVLEKHATHICDIMANNNRAYYTLTESRAIKWMGGLGAALTISLPEGETPLDWAVTQCNQLPLSAWDADDFPEKFRLAGDVAQIQLTVAIYAVLARYESGHEIDPEIVRNLAKKAWEHCHFLRQLETYGLEEPELDELAARVAVELGSPSEEWLIVQASSPQVEPRGLWAMVDAYIKKDGYPILANELASSLAARHRNIKGAGISTLRYLAMIWLLLEAADAALETAEILMEYHQRAMQRNDYIVVMRLLVLAARQKGPNSKTKRDIRYLYEYLWRNYTLDEEVEIKQNADAILA